jgi:hypothetical protein
LKRKRENVPETVHTREIGQLLVREIVDRSEVCRLVLVRVMAEVLKHLLQIKFNFVEGFDGINPAHDISARATLNAIFRLTWGDGQVPT